MRSAGEGLERSCEGPRAGWLASSKPADGVELFRAWFAGEAYQKHRHDTYAIGVTDSGVQEFDYRAPSTRRQRIRLSHRLRGTVPAHGRDTNAARTSVIAAVRERGGVDERARLSRAIDAAFHAPLESLAVDSLLVERAHGLMAGERCGAEPAISRRIDIRAIERARQFLDAGKTRVVHSRELESITGLTRYDLARQFRVRFGTSPYRYLLMRRLEFARERIHRASPLAEVACDAGFADQAHFTRAFRSAFGLTPARYRGLRESAVAISSRGSRR